MQYDSGAPSATSFCSSGRRCSLAIVVHAVAVRQQPGIAGDQTQVEAERVRRTADVPADRARAHAGTTPRSQGVAAASSTPWTRHSQQVRDRPAAATHTTSALAHGSPRVSGSGYGNMTRWSGRPEGRGRPVAHRQVVLVGRRRHHEQHPRPSRPVSFTDSREQAAGTPGCSRPARCRESLRRSRGCAGSPCANLPGASAASTPAEVLRPDTSQPLDRRGVAVVARHEHVAVAPASARHAGSTARDGCCDPVHHRDGVPAPRVDLCISGRVRARRPSDVMPRAVVATRARGSGGVRRGRLLTTTLFTTGPRRCGSRTSTPPAGELIAGGRRQRCHRSCRCRHDWRPSRPGSSSPAVVQVGRDDDESARRDGMPSSVVTDVPVTERHRHGRARPLRATRRSWSGNARIASRLRRRRRAGDERAPAAGSTNRRLVPAGVVGQQRPGEERRQRVAPWRPYELAPTRPPTLESISVAASAGCGSAGISRAACTPPKRAALLAREPGACSAVASSAEGRRRGSHRRACRSGVASTPSARTPAAAVFEVSNPLRPRGTPGSAAGSRGRPRRRRSVSLRTRPPTRRTPSVCTASPRRR